MNDYKICKLALRLIEALEQCENEDIVESVINGVYCNDTVGI